MSFDYFDLMCAITREHVKSLGSVPKGADGVSGSVGDGGVALRSGSNPQIGLDGQEVRLLAADSKSLPTAGDYSSATQGQDADIGNSGEVYPLVSSPLKDAIQQYIEEDRYSDMEFSASTSPALGQSQTTLAGEGGASVASPSFRGDTIERIFGAVIRAEERAK